LKKEAKTFLLIGGRGNQRAPSKPPANQSFFASFCSQKEALTSP
jgi:hypothetical protein